MNLEDSLDSFRSSAAMFKSYPHVKVPVMNAMSGW